MPKHLRYNICLFSFNLDRSYNITDSLLKASKQRRGENVMADGIQGLGSGFGGLFNNGWLMFLVFVLLVVGCGGCFGGFI